MRNLTVWAEQWPLHEPFVISRLVQEHSEVVVVEIEQDGVTGRGECERADAFFPDLPVVSDQIEAQRQSIENGLDRDALQTLMPQGPARCAIDCALWDLEAKLSGRPIHELTGLKAPLGSVTTVFTIGGPLQRPERPCRSHLKPV